MPIQLVLVLVISLFATVVGTAVLLGTSEKGSFVKTIALLLPLLWVVVAVSITYPFVKKYLGLE